MVKDPRAHEGLRTIVQNRLLEDILGNSSKKWPGWMVLIVDKPSLRVISSVIGMYDLMERRVTLVEDLTKKRAPFRDMAAIYLLAPTPDSVGRMIDDWTPSEERREPLYGDGVFMYFLNKLPDDLLGKIKGCRPLLKRAKGLTEVNIDFLAKEDRVFHFDMKNALRYLVPHRGQASRCELVICDKLVSLCATMNEYPHIRYRASSPLCTSLANVFHQKMTEFIGGNESWWYFGDANHTARGRSTLLLLDRSMDCLSPLMHEFTYQAMVYDLLPIDDDRITYKSETIGTANDAGDEKQTMDKDVLLNENDEVWVELRGKHIADVIQTLSNRIREMVNSNTSSVLKSKGNDTKALSLSQMANALKALPEYREVMDKLSQHMHLSHQCMEIFNKKGLLDLSELEQTLATGKMESGRVPKLNELVNLVEEQLQSMPDSVMRLRLLAILVVSQNGIRPVDKDRLLAAARLSPPELRVINNLEKMGCPTVQQQEQGNKLTSMFRQQKLVQGAVAESDSEYASSRYACTLKGIMEDMSEGKLSADDYPSVLPMPDEGSSGGTAASARSRGPVGSARRDKPPAKSRWAKTSDSAASAKSKATYSGGRQIVFVAGGMCYSEIRSMYEVMESGGREFVLGSTRFVSPKEFVMDLNSLG